MHPDGNPGIGKFILTEGEPTTIELNYEALEKMENEYLEASMAQVIPPGRSTDFRPGGQQPLMKETIPLIEAGKIVVVVVVVIEYSSPTDTFHRTRSCFIYSPESRKCEPYNKYNYMR